MRRPLLGVLLAAAAVCGLAADARGAPVARPLATGIEWPAAFTVLPDGHVLYAERFTGRLRLLDPATGARRTWFTVPAVSTSGERGVLGVALHPGYPAQPYVYVSATRTVGGQSRLQILRITEVAGGGGAMTPILDLPTAEHHNGGRLLFGPDGLLYMVAGDRASAANAQSLATLAGKVLRLTPAGGVPAANPFGTRVFAYGVRNSFGAAFDPQTGRLWETENGPQCNDELNRIVRGGNYGWGPSQSCATPPAAPRNTNRDGPSPIGPLRWYTPPIAPTGVAFCQGCGLGAGFGGTLLFGAVNTGQIRRVTLDAARMRVVSQAVVLTHPRGILSMERAPGGAILFSDFGGIYRLAAG